MPNKTISKSEWLYLQQRSTRERQRVMSVAEFTKFHLKIIILTLLFFSSSNTEFFGCGDGDGINVASKGISGSTNTTPKIKMTANSYSTLEMTNSGH